MQKNTSPDSTQACWGNIHQMQLDLRKTGAEWRNMLQNMLPHPTPGERDSFLMCFLIFVGARPSANKNVDMGGEE